MKKYLLPLILILILALGFITGYAQGPGGNKHWANTWTEIEELGEGKLGATIHVGHRVFKDKVDGQYKKHKLTDERPAKDYILIQSAKCCVEIYPYYAKYYDVDHEEVRLEEERWVVQRLFKAPDTWRDVDAYNPVISIEEVEDVIRVRINYDTDYGELIVEYFQRDSQPLKHIVYFTNTSSGTETFRVLQKWAGIAGVKCNDRYFPSNIEGSRFVFHDEGTSQRNFNISEDLYSMIFNEDGSEKTGQCLQRPVNIEEHAQGMKADFIYGNWILAQDESLEIDPDTATLDNPTEDGYLWRRSTTSEAACLTATIIRYNSANSFWYGGHAVMDWQGARAYVEWGISAIPDGATITDTVFKYQGSGSSATDAEINPLTEGKPSEATDANLWTYCGSGTAYVDPFTLGIGTNQSQDLGASADSDLEAALTNNWFAIGFTSDADACHVLESVRDSIMAEEWGEVDPPPTLYVEYSVPAEVNVIFFSTPF